MKSTINTLYSALIIAAGAAMMTGCDNYDDRYSPEYASVARLELYGEQEMTAWTINDVENYDIKILRSGHDIDRVSTVTLRAMTDGEWSVYAATYGLKRYHKMPSDCFTFTSGSNSDKTNIEFAPKQIAAGTSASIFSEKLRTFSNLLPPPEFEGSEYENVICLPIVIETTDGSVLPSQNTLLLKVKSRDASLSLSETGFRKIACLATSEATVIEYSVNLSCENPWGFSAKLENSAALLDEYNLANATRYTLVNGDGLEILEGDAWQPWTDRTLEFPAGINSMSFCVRLNPAKVGMMDAMALKVSEPSINITVDDAATSNIIAMQVKPSNTRIKVNSADISSSSDDGVHTAKNLIDGKRNTYFTTGDDVHDGDPVYGQYVDMKLPSPIRYFALDFMSRFDYFGEGEGIPNEVNIYVSEDGSAWELCGSISNMRRDFNGKSQTMTYGNFDAGKQISYVRWAVVKGGANGAHDLTAQATTAHWDASALYIFGK